MRRRIRLWRWLTWLSVAIVAMRLIAVSPSDWQRWRDAASALDDIAKIRAAALLFHQSAGQMWPPPERMGVAPRSLLPFLSGDVSFTRPRYRLGWEFATDSTSNMQMAGISVLGDDPRLALALAQRAPAGLPFIVSGRRFVALIGSAAER